MGAPLALRLHRSGYEVVAYNRSAAKLEPLIAQGIHPAATPCRCHRRL